MAILNNTLGAYLGVGASLIFMMVYVAFPKKNGINLKEGICTLLIVAVFTVLSATTVNTAGKNIVYSNFSGLANDFKTLIGANNNEEEDKNNTESNTVSGSVSGSTSSGNNSSAEASQDEDKNAVDNIGSGRGRLWGPAWKMALQKPFFGYGLENIKYEYDEQFDINEGRSHNLILQLAATTGIVGMLLYVVGIASIWIRKLKYIKEWDVYECLGMFVIVSYIISSLVGNSAFYTSGYFYIFVGFVVLSYPKETQVVDTKKKKA